MRVALAILAMGIATQLTRFFPFMVFRRREAPEWLKRGARLIPGAVMLTLVLTNIPLNPAEAGAYIQWIGAAIVVALHLIFKNTLVSIFGGTAIYMALLHFLS